MDSAGTTVNRDVEGTEGFGRSNLFYFAHGGQSWRVRKNTTHTRQTDVFAFVEGKVSLRSGVD